MAERLTSEARLAIRIRLAGIIHHTGNAWCHCCDEIGKVLDTLEAAEVQIAAYRQALEQVVAGITRAEAAPEAAWPGVYETAVVEVAVRARTLLDTPDPGTASRADIVAARREALTWAADLAQRRCENWQHLSDLDRQANRSSAARDCFERAEEACGIAEMIRQKAGRTTP